MPDFRILTIAAFLLMLLAAPAQADEEEDSPFDDDPEAKRCINTTSIRSTDVIDDNNIAFHMRGSKVYLNILPRRCTGLGRERRFSYTTSVGSLCSSDMIRILQDGGGGIMQGRSCRLGVFHPTTKEGLDAVSERNAAPPEAREPSMPEPQEIIPDEDPADSEEAD